MGEGHWVEVRVSPDRTVDEKRCVKALQQLRKELAAEGLPTQDVVEEPPNHESAAIAVALVGAETVVPTLVAVLRDWIHRRKHPAKVVLTFWGESVELDRSTFDEGAQSLKALLTRHQQR